MQSKVSKSTGTTGLGTDPSQWISQYAQMNVDMMQSALNNFSPMAAAWNNWYRSWMPPPMLDLTKSMATSLMPPMPKGSCDIPETGCPPRCACTVTWQASVGEVRRATIEIRNTSHESITYQLSPTAFHACGALIDSKPTVHPASVTAAAGQTATATVEVTVSDKFHPGATYHAEISVRGKYERCVKLELHMRCDDEEVCRFDHGDIPYRTRADQWYRHFQCSEPCFEPIQNTTTTSPTGTVDPVKPVQPNPTPNPTVVGTVVLAKP